MLIWIIVKVKVITWLSIGLTQSSVLVIWLSLCYSSASSLTPLQWCNRSVLGLYLVGKKREEREEGGRNEPGREVSCELEVLAPAGLPGKGTDLASHHTQPASAYVWACMWAHLLARRCMRPCVTGRAHKEGRTVSKRRIRKDNRERVRRQGEIKQRVCLN